MKLPHAVLPFANWVPENLPIPNRSILTAFTVSKQSFSELQPFVSLFGFGRRSDDRRLYETFVDLWKLGRWMNCQRWTPLSQVLIVSSAEMKSNY